MSDEIMYKQRLLAFLEDDDGYDDRCDAHISRIYYASDENAQTNIDRIFINFCGYSLKTIITGQEDG